MMSRRVRVVALFGLSLSSAAAVFPSAVGAHGRGGPHRHAWQRPAARVLHTLAPRGRHHATATIASSTSAQWPSTAAPNSVAFGPDGAMYVTDDGRRSLTENYVWRYANDQLSIYAGTGPYGVAGMGGPATQAQLANPQALAVDTAGNVFVGEIGTGTVARISAPSGVINWSPPGATGSVALAVNPSNNQVYWPGTVSRSTGIVTWNGSSAQLAVSETNGIIAIAFAPNGTLYYETYSSRYGDSVIQWTGSKKKTLATGLTDDMPGMVVDAAGNVFVSESADVKEIPASGAPPIVLAGGTCASPCANHGDDGPASSADLTGAGGLALDSQHNLYVPQFSYGVVRKIAATNGQLSPSSTISTILPNLDSQATNFMPVLRFDSSEEWRPLNVDGFFAEGQHHLCDAGTCSLITSTADLNGDRSPSAYVDVAGTDWTQSGDETTFHSPYSNCTSGGLRDCDTGPESAIYYRPDAVYGGYQYIDYWYFYRANYFWQSIDWHEGDWEGVTIAPESSGKTFDYAAFSQHGTYYAYLRDVLRCEDSPSGPIPSAGTCGTQSNRAWLLQNEFPFVSAVEALLVAFDVEFPVGVEVA